MNERPSSGSRLDPWVDSYAQRAKNVSGSAIRALFSVASRPEERALANLDARCNVLWFVGSPGI